MFIFLGAFGDIFLSSSSLSPSLFCFFYLSFVYIVALPTCGWHLYIRVDMSFESQDRAVFDLFTASVWSTIRDSPSFQSDKRQRIKWFRNYDRILVTHSKIIASDKKHDEVRIKSSYLIYSVGRIIVAAVSDFWSVLCDWMIADCAVVAHDEA